MYKREMSFLRDAYTGARLIIPLLCPDSKLNLEVMINGLCGLKIAGAVFLFN